MKPRIGLLVCALVALPAVAHADVERYAIVIGNNSGASDEINLRYAVSDAQKMHDVLRELGGVRPENIVMLHNEDAKSVRRTLIAVNDRIRTRTSQGRVEASLLVYYSGHADAESLHLGNSSLDLRELEQLVRGSPARFRLMVLDSCRSGALTRVKGGHQAPPFVVELDDHLAEEGVVFLTSSSANEDAQESDKLKGSFFTHYFVSGLLGAADENNDGQVVLAEAYQYTYANTVRTSSRTLAGTQHPTFRYEARGKGDIVLTRLTGRDGRRSWLQFPKGHTYLVFRGNADGAVVAEVGEHSKRRRISVKAGRYFVRGRARDHLLEGTVDAKPRHSHMVRATSMRRVAYARLVRKGLGVLDSAHSLQLGVVGQNSIASGATLCRGAFVGYALERPQFTLSPRLGYCGGSFANSTLSATVHQLDAELRLLRAIDLPVVTLEIGVLAGASFLAERFDTRGLAPARNVAAGKIGAVLGLSRDLTGGFYLALEAAAQTYFLRERNAMSTPTWDARFAVRASLVLGWRWSVSSKTARMFR